MGNLLQDVRYGLRTLAKNPAFTLIAVLTLALGIGANAAIFSLTDQVLLRLLPVARPQELVVLHSPGKTHGRTWNDIEGGQSFSYPMYKDLRDRNEVFAGVLARFHVQVSVAGQGTSQLAEGELVSGNYFRVLGVRPALGRVFSPQDETAAGANPVTVLSYGYWTRHFGSDPNILNKQLAVNGNSLTVVGVARSGFAGVQVGQVPDLFIPITMKALMTPNWDGLTDRNDHWVTMLARLKPGISAPKAEAGLAPLYRALMESDAAALKLSSRDRQEFVNRKLLLDTGSHGRPVLQHDAKEPLLVLMGMVGLVLLIACANLAGLLIARGEGRQREIALRLALGAGRARLVRQLMTESLLLAIAGGAAGLALASWTLNLIVSSIPDSEGASGLTSQLDYRVLLFACAISLITGVLFGLAPAIRATRADLQSVLKDQGANVSGGKANVRVRKSLMVSQIALTAVLLAAAGLFAHSLLNLRGQDLGVRPDHVLEFSLSPELNRYTPAQTILLADRIRKGIEPLPGVRSVSQSEIPMLANSNSSSNITAEGYNAQEDENMDVDHNAVGPNFLATLGIPLLNGREFSEADTSTSPKVAIVNEAMARRFYAGRNPVGLHFGFGGGKGTKIDIEIVGVVKDSKNTGVRQTVHPFVFLPYSQSEQAGNATFYVRTNQDPAALTVSVRNLVEGLDSNLPIYDVRTLTAQVDDIMFTDRLVTVFSLALGMLASLLAAVGLYGVMAYVVARRTREIGIRMALGATQKGVAWMILREILGMLAAGLAVGLIAAYAVGRLIESQLFGVKASDPLVFVIAAVLLVAVALLAGWLPSRKAAGVDPMVALRYE
ncbi:MAG: ABC transporter permease [Candidatus Acidiferrales bacterium]